MKHSLTTYKHIFKQIPQLNTHAKQKNIPFLYFHLKNAQIHYKYTKQNHSYIHIPQLNTHAKQKLYIFVLYAFLAIKNTISQNIFTN